MAINFTFRDNLGNFYSTSPFEIEPASSASTTITAGEKVHFFADKLKVPMLVDYIPRSRLNLLLRNSMRQIGSVLITGRTGTGKTSLAAHFAQDYDETIWYRVEAADTDWKLFSNYLFKAVRHNPLAAYFSDVAHFVEKLLTTREGKESRAKRIIVLDDVHNVFDAPWFAEFFTTCLASQPANTHLLFLSRSKPSLPLWRMRSKQSLAFIDEKLLVFNKFEAAKFCKMIGVSNSKAAKLFEQSHGRIGKLKALSVART